jgi:hypothetical protein
MSITEEQLLAYADGELDTLERQEVEKALAAEPALLRVVDEHRELRKRIASVYQPVLDEPLPSRLLDVLQGPSQAQPGATVVDLAEARDRRDRTEAVRAPWASRRSFGAALAASLLLGLAVGLALPMLREGAAGPQPFISREGQVVAQGPLAQALSNQLASSQASGAPVRMGVSFASTDGHYCRSFIDGTIAGVACRQGNEWRLRVIASLNGSAETVAASAPGGLRTASTTWPAAVTRAVDELIEGTALDAEAERGAAQRGWQGK